MREGLLLIENLGHEAMHLLRKFQRWQKTFHTVEPRETHLSVKSQRNLSSCTLLKYNEYIGTLYLQVLSQVCIGIFQQITTSTKERGNSILNGLVMVTVQPPAVVDVSIPAANAVSSDKYDTK